MRYRQVLEVDSDLVAHGVSLGFSSGLSVYRQGLEVGADLVAHVPSSQHTVRPRYHHVHQAYTNGQCDCLCVCACGVCVCVCIQSHTHKNTHTHLHEHMQTHKLCMRSRS